MKSRKSTIPKYTPTNTTWYGGPIEWFRITLRIFGDNLDPSSVSKSIGVNATEMGTKGNVVLVDNEPGKRIANTGEWKYSFTPKMTDEWDLDNAIVEMFSTMNCSKKIWSRITKRNKADLFIGLTMYEKNKGFELSSGVMELLAGLNIKIGFDIYYEERRPTNGST